MKKINFMGESFERAKARRRSILRMSLVLLALTVGGWVWLKIESSERLESIKAELTALKQRTNGLEAADRSRHSTTTRVRMQQALETPVPAASVIAAVAEHTSPSVGLISLSLVGEPVDPAPVGSDKKKRRKTKNRDDSERTSLLLVLEGLAPDDMTVARLIEQLDTRPLFDKVELGFCRPTEDGEYEGRDFRITAQVSLDRTVVIEPRREVTRAN